MKSLHLIAVILLVIGGLNWGLVGLGYFAGAGTDYNVVRMILAPVSVGLENLVYLLVGLSALYLGVGHKKTCNMCSASGM
ncbi:DUF378 domain-containing protein [Candidatus Kaiserbacteria bacterium CG10_big_fil_rev_8_21_14_0_10_56_12]|uniref:DUF378 domain-containing protein n=1 Tax=Candidatus Kaiserbacteria bacterium CG10_big_fil_rev_8_21_14_0_10_56_12 TaxID=1974611 RepID=A0A2H0UAL7_9BACT|nr:MAG: DUF378 domain-containing protein [Candidatus Kaiserbacteria bacterium CG10_big_fil_rev_8_21_14_0_10_56_12]